MFLGSPVPRLLRFDQNASRIRADRGSLVAPSGLLTNDDPALKSTETGLVALLLPRAVLMERQLDLPGLSLQAASAAARLDLLRRTPFRPDEVHTLLAPLSGKGLFRQWVIRKVDVDAISARLARLGLKVGPVLVEGDEAAGFLADLSDRSLPMRRNWRRLNAALAIGLVATAAGLWLMPGLLAGRHERDLSGDVEMLRNQATELRREVEALRAAQEEQQTFLAGIIGRPRLLDVIRDLTVALPDEVWISDLVFDGTTSVMSGEINGSAAELVLTLSKRREFSNPRLAGPVARTASGTESFELALDLGGNP